MPLDPQALRFLNKLARLEIPTVDQIPLSDLRAMVTPIPGKPDSIAGHDHRFIPGPDPNVELQVRIYWPARHEDVPDATPWPVMVYFHGGGWVMGNLEAYDILCRKLANALSFRWTIGLRPNTSFPHRPRMLMQRLCGWPKTLRNWMSIRIG